MSDHNTREIPLTKGKVAIVDADDYEWLVQWKWMYSNSGYAVRKVREDGKPNLLPMHRVLSGALKGFDTDHINGDKLDNRRINLRICTRSQNQTNRGNFKNSKSGYKGVHWVKQCQKWRVKLCKDGKIYYGGHYDTAELAAKAVNELAMKIHGEYAWLNKPPQN